MEAYTQAMQYTCAYTADTYTLTCRQRHTCAFLPLSLHRTHTRRWAQETDTYAHLFIHKSYVVVHLICHAANISHFQRFGGLKLYIYMFVFNPTSPAAVHAIQGCPVCAQSVIASGWFYRQTDGRMHAANREGGGDLWREEKTVEELKI